MNSVHESNMEKFNLKEWKPLTELPQLEEDSGIATPSNDVSKTADKTAIHPSLAGVSPGLIKLLWDIICYLYSSVSVRIKRLGVSCSSFKNAETEGCDKGFIIRSAAGQTIYLIPRLKTFNAFNMPCPFDSDKILEHSFYRGLCCFLLKKDVRFKTVQPELKRRDIVTTGHDGTKMAWEVTLSTTNLLSNVQKYADTSYVTINLVCRDFRLKEAVKACCHQSGLDPELLAKLDYMHISQLLRRQRRLSLY